MISADGWQIQSLRKSEGREFKVLCAVLAVEMPDQLPIMLRVAYPGFVDLDLPVLIGYATIQTDGGIYCRMYHRDRSIDTRPIYESEEKLRSEFRKLADGLKLKDADRHTMFGLIQKWISADLRVDERGRRRLVR